ncbi:uncharacterized protein LOC135198365 [Macrobrachium nipponense]|uniref:uncharacterized protein LOC135198365 n=1 Tax=Macrobrachium nipponense TaxID=159736 RepID=UPI0030C8698E
MDNNTTIFRWKKDFEWDRRATLLLIDQYRQRPCLWNAKDEQFRVRCQRVAAIESITEELKKRGLSVNKVKVKNKIECILNQYRRELRMLKKSKTSVEGDVDEDTHIPKLWFFDELGFLRDGDNKGQSTTALESHVPDDTLEDSDYEVYNDLALTEHDDSPAAITTTSPDSPVPGNSQISVTSAMPNGPYIKQETIRAAKRPCVITESHEVLQEALHQLRTLSRPEDDNESDFGNVVANDLRQMSNRSKICAQKLISDVLFLGKLGRLSPSSMVVE